MEATKKYITTKEECQKVIDRRGEIVCTCCGGKIEPIETVDNSQRPTYWQGCVSCSKFDIGTTPRVYKIAVQMVDERRFRAYSDFSMPYSETHPDEFDYWRKVQIGGTVDVVKDVLRIHDLLTPPTPQDNNQFLKRK